MDCNPIICREKFDNNIIQVEGEIYRFLNKSLLPLGLPCYNFLSLSLSLYIYIYIYIYNFCLYSDLIYISTLTFIYIYMCVCVCGDESVKEL